MKDTIKFAVTTVGLAAATRGAKRVTQLTGPRETSIDEAVGALEWHSDCTTCNISEYFRVTPALTPPSTIMAPAPVVRVVAVAAPVAPVTAPERLFLLPLRPIDGHVGDGK